jgi:hypothetical protein
MINSAVPAGGKMSFVAVMKVPVKVVSYATRVSVIIVVRWERFVVRPIMDMIAKGVKRESIALNAEWINAKDAALTEVKPAPRNLNVLVDRYTITASVCDVARRINLVAMRRPEWSMNARKRV